MNSFQAECLTDSFFLRGKQENASVFLAITMVSILCVYGIVINICLFIFNSLLRRVSKRIPDIPLPRDTIQLSLRNPAILQEAIEKNPKYMSKPPQLTSFDWFLLADISNLSLTSKETLEISWH